MGVPVEGIPDEPQLVDVSEMPLRRIVETDDPAIRAAIAELVSLLDASRTVSQGWANYLESDDGAPRTVASGL